MQYTFKWAQEKRKRESKYNKMLTISYLSEGYICVHCTILSIFLQV